LFVEHDNKYFNPGMTAACQLLTEHRSIGSCDACAFRNLCLGGCMGLALDHAGTVYGVDDFCQYRKTVYSRAFDKLLMRAEQGG
jgi:MoaA/NifB/PqqE/SkfB family radical SAM enzyme